MTELNCSDKSAFENRLGAGLV